ncbi:MAG: hypothetical protein ACI8XX_002317, partial [Polaribacter sp.]
PCRQAGGTAPSSYSAALSKNRRIDEWPLIFPITSFMSMKAAIMA